MKAVVEKYNVSVGDGAGSFLGGALAAERGGGFAVVGWLAGRRPRDSGKP